MITGTHLMKKITKIKQAKKMEKMKKMKLFLIGYGCQMIDFKKQKKSYECYKERNKNHNRRQKIYKV